MGTTFSTIQIQNSKNLQPEQLKESLCNYFFKKGLIPATEEDAQFSFWLAYSDERNWTAFGSGDYDLDSINEDMHEIAKELNTYCIVTNVWDSDFFELELFGPTDMQRDKMVVGDPLSDDILDMGNRELWKPLITESKTWEQLTEICNKRHTLPEHTLCEFAPFLGISPENVTCNYDCCDEFFSDNPNVIDLYFKKAQQ